jgi:uncharacterized damage-inducible protein DinB
MNTHITLKQVLIEDAEVTYTITDKLFRRVNDSELSWIPPTGKNWMTVGQLLMHSANYGCGKAIRCFITGEWGMDEYVESDNHKADQHVPPSEALPSVESVGQALELLVADRNLTLSCIDSVDEHDLLTKKILAPWGGSEVTLLQHLLQMIAHLAQHKGQLFYYLKLMGKDVNTTDLWDS